MTCGMDGKSLRHPLRHLHKLRTPLGKKLRASNLRIWRNRRKLLRNRTRRAESKNSTATTTGLQLRSCVTKQGFRHTLGATTEHLQPVIRNTVGHTTPIARKETIYTRRWTTDVRDGRHRHGTCNDSTARYVTSTSSSRPLPDSPTA